MREVSIGGERLGSGKKMKVGLHGFERSTHDLGYLWRSTMSAGTLVPFMSEIALPGDTFDIDLNADVMTAPTVGPLFGSFKVQLDVFQVPIRLYNSLLHNNMLGIGNDMKRVKFPVVSLGINSTVGAKDINNSQISPSCILNYLGVRGVGFSASSTSRTFNAIPLLAYWDIYKNYYSAKQEKQGAVISNNIAGVGTITSVVTTDPVQTIAAAPTLTSMDDLTPTTRIRVNYTTAPNPDVLVFNVAGRGQISYRNLCVNVVDYGTYLEGIYNFALHGLTYIENYQTIGTNDTVNVPARVQFFPLDNIDNMRKAILAYSNEAVPFSVNGQTYAPYNWLLGISSDGRIFNRQGSQEGLGIKTYQSDLLNNWLDTTWIGSINTASAVSTLAGNFTIDQLNFSKKVYEMLNRIAISGGSYNDWLDAVYDHERNRIPESPIYHGGLIKELVFQEVVSTAATNAEVLGTLAGRGKLSGKHKGGKVVIKIDEPSYIMGIVSLTPRIDYSQGNKWDVNLQTMDDLHKPNLDEIGFQDLITEQMAFWDTWWDGTKWVRRSAGKQPAWLNYMTNYNRTFGNFAINGNQMFMTLNRNYEFDSQSASIKDLTSYIDPAKYNNIFAATSIDAQNFWVQIGVDITARRKMSAKIMPNL